MRKVTIVIDDPNERMISEAIVNAVNHIDEDTGIAHLEIKSGKVPSSEHRELLQVPKFMKSEKKEAINLPPLPPINLPPLPPLLGLGTKSFNIPFMTGVRNG